MPGKQVTELDALPSFTDTSLLPVHNGAGLKKGSLSQLANYLGTKFSNPNLLINPDFKINQRAKSTYSSTGAGGTVDRWVGTNVKTVVNSDNTVTVSSLSGTGYYTQHEENISYGKHTYSIYVQAITGTVKAFYKSKDSKDIELGTLKQGLNTFTSVDDGFKSFFLSIAGGSSVTLKYAKVEQGAVATSFIAPNYAEEILKCQRFYVVLESSLAGYGANSAIYIPFARGVYMRNSRNVIFTGANKQTFLRVNGTGKQISFNTTNGYANNQYVRVYTNPVDTSLNNTAIGVDLNDVTISVDAEIY